MYVPPESAARRTLYIVYTLHGKRGEWWNGLYSEIGMRDDGGRAWWGLGRRDGKTEKLRPMEHNMPSTNALLRSKKLDLSVTISKSSTWRIFWPLFREERSRFREKSRGVRTVCPRYEGSFAVTKLNSLKVNQIQVRHVCDDCSRDLLMYRHRNRFIYVERGSSINRFPCSLLCCSYFKL